MRFADQTIVITGASSGIGHALARQLGKEGAQLHLLGRNTDRLAAVAADAGGAVTHVVEFRDPEDLERAATKLAAEVERVDVLLHSAGVVTLGRIDTAPIAELDENFAVNLRAPVRLTQALLPHLKRARGQVVFVNSGAGLNANANWGHYAASKFGLKAVADALRQEVHAEGVRVMTAFPGRTATPMQERVRALEGAPYDAAAFIQPDDVARMLLEGLSLPRSADLIELNIRPGPKT